MSVISFKTSIVFTWKKTRQVYFVGRRQLSVIHFFMRISLLSFPIIIQKTNLSFKLHWSLSSQGIKCLKSAVVMGGLGHCYRQISGMEWTSI